MNRNEVIEAMKASVKRDAYNHIAITCDPESFEFTVERLVTGEKLAGPFSEIAAADDAQHELVIRECMESALTALESIMEKEGLKMLDGTIDAPLLEFDEAKCKLRGGE
jgi:hypothetical protein